MGQTASIGTAQVKLCEIKEQPFVLVPLAVWDNNLFGELKKRNERRFQGDLEEFKRTNRVDAVWMTLWCVMAWSGTEKYRKHTRTPLTGSAWQVSGYIGLFPSSVIEEAAKSYSVEYQFDSFVLNNQFVEGLVRSVCCIAENQQQFSFGCATQFALELYGRETAKASSLYSELLWQLEELAAPVVPRLEVVRDQQQKPTFFLIGKGDFVVCVEQLGRTVSILPNLTLTQSTWQESVQHLPAFPPGKIDFETIFSTKTKNRLAQKRPEEPTALKSRVLMERDKSTLPTESASDFLPSDETSSCTTTDSSASGRGNSKTFFEKCVETWCGYSRKNITLGNLFPLIVLIVVFVLFASDKLLTKPDPHDKPMTTELPPRTVVEGSCEGSPILMENSARSPVNVTLFNLTIEAEIEDYRNIAAVLTEARIEVFLYTWLHVRLFRGVVQHNSTTIVTSGWKSRSEAVSKAVDAILIYYQWPDAKALVERVHERGTLLAQAVGGEASLDGQLQRLKLEQKNVLSVL